MNTVDTSVVVPAFASWHPAHEVARRQLASSPRLPGHVALQAYSVLTRLPAPHRARPSQVSAFLRAEFRDPWLVLSGAQVASLVEELVALDIAGGPAYDALIGATARVAGATLITRDRRALAIYQRLGVNVDFVG